MPKLFILASFNNYITLSFELVFLLFFVCPSHSTRDLFSKSNLANSYGVIPLFSLNNNDILFGSNLSKL